MSISKSLGVHPDEGLPVYLKHGPFGPYVQLGDDENNSKPKRIGIPNHLPLEELSLDEAVALLTLPRYLGKHPTTGKDVHAGNGRFGPYVLHDRTYAAFARGSHTFQRHGKTYDVLTVDLPVALAMLNAIRPNSN